MIILKSATEVARFVMEKHKNGAVIGLVPTMGALHQGHISLLEKSKQLSSITVSSIFVNPTQFNNASDFEKYPITIEKDIDMLEAAGCDMLFLPSVIEMYPYGTAKLPNYNLGFLETVLEGKFRPGHFQGVCQVVDRLLNIIQPDLLFLGQKDYQQCMVIGKMKELVKINTQIIICPTLREPNGLAMSSRNLRLTSDEKKKASKIYETLCFIKKEIKPGYLQDLKERARQYLTEEGFEVDYIEIANSTTLESQESWDGKMQLVVLAAAFINEVRLIDNITLQH